MDAINDGSRLSRESKRDEEQIAKITTNKDIKSKHVTKIRDIYYKL